MSVEREHFFENNSALPLYHVLREQLAKKILNYEWKPGEKIPSETELCKMYYVSRITVRKAVEDLERSGMLIKRQGKGTFVTSVSMEHKLSKFYSFSEELKQRGIKERVQVIAFDIVGASEKIAEKLDLQQDKRVIALKRLRMADDMPYTVETSYLPYSTCSNLTAQSIVDNGLYNTMRSHNIFPERIIEKLKATAVDKNDADLMKIKTNSPAIRLERLTYFGTDVIEYCVSTVRGDFFTYSIELKI